MPSSPLTVPNAEACVCVIRRIPLYTALVLLLVLLFSTLLHIPRMNSSFSSFALFLTIRLQWLCSFPMHVCTIYLLLLLYSPSLVHKIECSLLYLFRPSFSPLAPQCLHRCLLEYTFYLAPLFFYSLHLLRHQLLPSLINSCLKCSFYRVFLERF